MVLDIFSFGIRSGLNNVNIRSVAHIHLLIKSSTFWWAYVTIWNFSLKDRDGINTSHEFRFQAETIDREFSHFLSLEVIMKRRRIDLIKIIN